MPSVPLKMLPGIDIEKSEVLNESGFSASQLMRFFQKKAQKLGGWSRITSTQLVGTCRGLFAWADLTGVGYIAAGTEQRLQVWNEGSIYDITPIYATDALNSPFTTVINSNFVDVVDMLTTPSTGDWIYIEGPVTVGGLTLNGFYQVADVYATFYQINAGSAATSSTTGGGYVTIEYLLPTGLLTSSLAMGWGEGGWGLGPWGTGGASNIPTLLRQWSFGQFGRILIACPIGGQIYSWDPQGGFSSNPAAIISNSPTIATGIFVAMQQQQIIAYGITDPNTGLQDPMLIGWCDVGNMTVWTASATNQAGTFRLARGSKIVGGIQGPQYGMLWTDLGVWLQQYIGFPLVYGFNEIAQGCGLISMRSIGVLGGIVYWCSLNQFYLFNGASVAPLTCTVWDIFFQNANFSEQDQFLLAPNSHFNEFFYFFLNLSGVIQYIKYNQVDNVWDYGTLTRTAWFDQNDVLANNPIGVDSNGLIQQHETTNDADGEPMLSSITTGFFKLSEGLVIIFLERMIPDFVATVGVSIQITVNMVDYPDDTPLFSETFTWIAGTTEYIIVRGRGRFAQLTISSSGLGSFWRLGEFLWIGTGSGRRP